MTRITRVLIISTAVLMAATGLGCGAINHARGVLAAAKVLGDFADRLEKHNQLTYTADYTFTSDKDQAAVTLVQKPPNVAYLGKSGRFIFTAESLFLCDTEKGKTTCQKTPNSASEVDANQAAFVSGVAGPGFVTPELALGLVIAAAVVPGAKVDQSEKTIAGQKSLCANVTGLENAASPNDEDAVKDFSVCITEGGVLASFNGSLQSGEKAGVELTKYSGTADPSAFVPPAGAKIVDVTQLQPS
jgi:hypothetical protein